MKNIIYETKGRAREFNELAINLFTGCEHRCIYCYGADVTHQDKATFDHVAKPRVSVADIERSASEYGKRGEKRPILLCFVTDPYQPVEAETQLTRHTIRMLKEYGLRVTILTKGGNRAMRDFDLLVPGENAFAVTLTLTDPDESLKWEPGAALPAERIASLREAHRLGLETWVSLEPVIRPAAVYALLEQTKGFVGHYKVGTMNYHPHGRTINWYQFGIAVKARMEGMGVRYYLKQDLRREMGYTGSAWGGPWRSKHSLENVRR